MAGQNGQGAVDLLGQHDSGELMRQSDLAERKKKIRALTCGRRPSVGGPDGEDEALSTLVTDASEVSGELLGGVLLAAAVEQNGVGRSAAGLAIQPLEHSGFRVEEVRVAGDIARDTLDIFREQTIGRL